MNLTREQAIAEHRKMWNWIADEIERVKSVVYIAKYKERYIETNGFANIENDCFMCEYVFENIKEGNCKICPINPCANYIFNCLGGLYEKCYNAKTWQEQAKFARQIANLPERTDV